MSLHVICVKAEVPQGSPPFTQQPCPEGHFMATVEQPDPVILAGDEWATSSVFVTATILAVYFTSWGVGVAASLVRKMS